MHLAGLRSVRDEDAEASPSSAKAKEKAAAPKSDSDRNRRIIAALADSLASDVAAHEAAVELSPPEHPGSQHLILLALSYACQRPQSKGDALPCEILPGYHTAAPDTRFQADSLTDN